MVYNKNMKWKVWLGKDNVYNKPYYKIIGEVEQVSDGKNVFSMEWKRWVPYEVIKRDIKLKPVSMVVWKLEKQTSLFLITNRNSQGIYLVELFNDDSRQTFRV